MAIPNIDECNISCDEGHKNAPIERSDFIFMHHIFPHGEVPHLPSFQPAAFAVNVATDSISGSTSAQSERGVEPLDPVAPSETHDHWSLPWVQKLSSIRRGEKHESP